MPIDRSQLRMSPDDLEDMLATERTMRVGTVSAEGRPHVVPLWFVWADGVLWINNLRRSKRSSDIAAGSAVSCCIDTGVEYGELRGAVLDGRFEPAGDDPALDGIRLAFGAKYFGGIAIPDVKSHEWLRMIPDRVVTWDFRKIPQGRDKRLEAVAEQEDPGAP